MPTPLANQGRLPPTICRPPHNLEHDYPDRQERGIKAVEIVVLPSLRGSTSRNNNWAVVWEVGSVRRGGRTIPVIRVLHVSTERWRNPLNPARDQEQHVFWGPITQAMGDLVQADHESYIIAEMSWEARQALEVVAKQTPVMVLDGVWNGQTWVTDLLSRAVKARILTAMHCDPAIRAAQATPGPVRR